MKESLQHETCSKGRGRPIFVG